MENLLACKIVPSKPQLSTVDFSDVCLHNMTNYSTCNLLSNIVELILSFSNLLIFFAQRIYHICGIRTTSKIRVICLSK